MLSVDEQFSEESYHWKSFHDTVIESMGESWENDKYSRERLRRIFDKLPEYVRDQAQVWGISDSVVRDDACVYIRKHPEIVTQTA
jgi:hypothetical protein